MVTFDELNANLLNKYMNKKKKMIIIGSNFWKLVYFLCFIKQFDQISQVYFSYSDLLSVDLVQNKSD